MPPDARRHARLLRFAASGGIGFLADAAVLHALVAGAGLGPVVARFASIAFALGVTWLLNRRFTFGPSRRRVVAEGARYGGVGVGASLLNLAVYTGIVAAAPAVSPLAALVAASAAAMGFSWLGYSRFVFDR